MEAVMVSGPPTLFVIGLILQQTMKSKLQILARYVGDQPKKHQNKQPTQNIRDIDQAAASSDSSSEQDRPERIESQDEEEKKPEMTKDEKMKKKFKEALGVENEDEIDEFLKHQLVIENAEGVDLRDLRRKKVKLTMEGAANAHSGPQYGQDQNVKLEAFMQGVKEEPDKQEEDEDSDIEVNRQALPPTKTIFRNKDGTIKEHSQQVQKQLHKKAVLHRLGQWQKGMKQIDQKNKPVNQLSFGNTDISDDYKLELAQRELFEDPMRQIKTTMRGPEKISLFKCKYSGPGNRFGIAPGHRWDGVVRGNGFQFKHIQHQNSIKDKHDEEMREYLRDL